MACKNMRFRPGTRRSDEVVPVGLRETVCLVRERNPDRYATVMRARGVELDDIDVEPGCRHNHDASWKRCPLFVTERG